MLTSSTKFINFLPISVLVIIRKAVVAIDDTCFWQRLFGFLTSYSNINWGTAVDKKMGTVIQTGRYGNTNAGTEIQTKH